MLTAAELLLSGYSGLFLTAFLAATLVPLSSEAVLAALSAADGFDVALLFAIATLGNTLGAAVNWALGRYCLKWRGRKWFPFSAAQLDRAGARFRRHGIWSLLFAWLPVVGDPLTFAAGVLQVRFLPFLVLVGLGKGARYAAVLWLANTVVA
ncbi:MAG: DedA family protein [Alphaproteobacteria bacterium]|nr:DedA family protein [Alphaproteobacteria bacterium]